MVLITVGFNHKTAPLLLREKLAFGEHQATQLLRDFLGDHLNEKTDEEGDDKRENNPQGIREITEAALISTCNRTELYWLENWIEHQTETIAIDQDFEDTIKEATEKRTGIEAREIKEQIDSGVARTLHWLARKTGISFEELNRYAYSHSEVQVVKHLLRVASGLDSMVLGEVEILGQLKASYRQALEAGTLGRTLDRLFQFAFSVTKRIRSRTGVGENPVSIASLAVRLAIDLAKRIFTKLQDTKVLIIGAGNLSRLTAVHLKTTGVKKILVVNRTLDASQNLASIFDAENAEQGKNSEKAAIETEVFDFDLLPQRLYEADIVLSGTASPLPIIGKGMVERALKLRKHRPMVMVDLAMPRDIEPEIAALEDVYLYCLDDLQGLAQQNLDLRKEAALQAEDIITEEAPQFMHWLHSTPTFDTVKTLHRKMQMMREQILRNALKQLELGKSPEIVLCHALHGLGNRFLHEPTLKLRQSGISLRQSSIQSNLQSGIRSGISDNTDLLQVVRYLFDLNEEYDELNYESIHSK